MNPPTDCPRCGQPGVTEAACPRCGVIVAKARSAARPPAVSPPAESAPDWEEDEERSGPSPLVLVIAGALVLLAAAVGHRLWTRSHRPPEAVAVAPRPESSLVRTGVPDTAPLDVTPPAFEFSPPPLPPQLPTGVPDGDRARAEALLKKVLAHAPLGAADVQAAEELLSRSPDAPGFRDLLESVLITAAQQHQRQRQFGQAVAYLQRARDVQPRSTAPLLLLIEVAMATGDWAAAEAAARTATSIEPREFKAWEGLSYALMRQDRNREAVEAIRSALEIRDDANLRALMERIQRGLSIERGMSERRVSHFTVRYDGGEHEEVGREIVRALERDYATLATALDYEPKETIPVILFTQEGYYNANGAPAWSGGNYDLIDGRIRIPIGGLTRTLNAHIDDVLIHELTHAFVADRTRGVPPEDMRILQEGFAQYMAGNRIEQMLSRPQLTALADGRIGGVGGLYLGALSFVEYLIANRGLGGMNDLIKAIGETGSVDEGFRQVHGTSMRGTYEAWSQRFRQQHGSG